MRAERWVVRFVGCKVMPDELAENMSFAKLLRTKGDEVKRSLGERPLRFPKPRAVQLAIPFIDDYGPPPWPWQPWSWRLLDVKTDPHPRRLPWTIPDRPNCNEDGSE
jgi:hypothetical protein